MLEIIIWIFAIYGIWGLVKDVFEVKEAICLGKGKIEIVIKVCNQEDKVEFFVKEVKKIIPNSKITVEDWGSTDETYSKLIVLMESNNDLNILRK